MKPASRAEICASRQSDQRNTLSPRAVHDPYMTLPYEGLATVPRGTYPDRFIDRTGRLAAARVAYKPQCDKICPRRPKKGSTMSVTFRSSTAKSGTRCGIARKNLTNAADNPPGTRSYIANHTPLTQNSRRNLIFRTNDLPSFQPHEGQPCRGRILCMVRKHLRQLEHLPTHHPWQNRRSCRIDRCSRSRRFRCRRRCCVHPACQPRGGRPCHRRTLWRT